MTLKLKALLRKLKGKKTRKLRREGIIPGAVARYKKDTVLVKAPEKEVRKLKKISATDIVLIEVEGLKEEIKTLLTELLEDPITGELLSFTLTEITPKSKLRVEVPIEIVGESPIVKKGLGVLVISKPFIKLVVNSENIIPTVKVDISKLEEIGDTITVKDLLSELPETIKLANYKEINDAVVTIVALQKTLEEEAAEAEQAEAAEGEVAAEEGAEETTGEAPAEAGEQSEAGE